VSVHCKRSGFSLTHQYCLHGLSPENETKTSPSYYLVKDSSEVGALSAGILIEHIKDPLQNLVDKFLLQIVSDIWLSQCRSHRRAILTFFLQLFESNLAALHPNLL
jgi:hypothetical protein